MATYHAEKNVQEKQYVGDTESNDYDASGEYKTGEGPLKRQLKNRHIAMIRSVKFSGTFFILNWSRTEISLAVSVVCGPFTLAWFLLKKSGIKGVIGTGLFLGTANALRNGGPIGLILGYAIVGTICYSVMVRTLASFRFFLYGELKLEIDFVGRNGRLSAYSWRPH